VATRKATVRFTANFERNLAQIGTYCAERDAPQAYASLLDELGTVIVSNPRTPSANWPALLRANGAVRGDSRASG